MDLSNRVAQNALESIWAVINTKTGVSHPTDKATVIDAFKILRHAGEQYDPEEIRLWLISRGMDTRDASDIVEIAIDPTKFRSQSKSVLKEDILSDWRTGVE